MYFVDGWEKSRQRFTALWKGEILDRCCVSVKAPADGSNYSPGPFPEDHEGRVRYWTDGEWVLKRNLAKFESTYYTGDAFPLLWLNLGAAGHAAYFKNARYQFERNTVWFFQSVGDWGRDKPQFDPEGFMFQKTLELARYLTDESRGRYFVSMPDTSGNLDVLAHLRGTENLLVDLVTDEDSILEALEPVQKAWEKTVDEAFAITAPGNLGGSCIGWLDTWAPGRHSQLQSDISVMLSPGSFRKFILPELKAQSEYLTYPLYHFDGIEQIRHLDMLLSLENLKMIQWTCVAGQPSPLEYIPILKRIQAAGKCLLIIVKPQEVEPIMEQLSSRGLFLVVNCSSRIEADSIMKIVNRSTHE